MPLFISRTRGNMKSVGVTLSPDEFSILERLGAAYNANRSEIIRASIRAVWADYQREKEALYDNPLQLDAFSETK